MYVQIDGRPPTVEALQHRVLANYGHFTSMQVRDGRVQGLDLHLRRLSEATGELFDTTLPPERVRQLIRAALDGGGSSGSVRVDVFRLPAADDASVMVSVRPPAEPAVTPRRLRSVVFQRPIAHLKHAGTFPQTYYGERAERDGFDEALFVGPDGAVYEGSVTNIGFVDHDTVVWTEGPMLLGIMRQLLDAALSAVGVPTARRTVRLDELPSFRAAFLTNSIGVVPVGSVDGADLPVDRDAMDLVERAYRAVAWDPI